MRVLSEPVSTLFCMIKLENRVRQLEVSVGRLETWAGPGQAEALAQGQRYMRADLARIRTTQDRHTRMIADLTSDVAGLKTDVAELKTDVAELKTDVAELKTDVAELKTDVAEIRADMAGLRSDMTSMKGTLHDILSRLPAAPDPG
jgi:chromosome segregation ATPase